jgi:DNA-binding NtrC family response regulator
MHTMTANLKLKRGIPLNPAGNRRAPVLGSILIVDHDRELAGGLQRVLGRRFALVEAAHSIEQAEQLRQRCRFDLLICAVHLPDSSGLTWIESLRAQGVTTEVIFMTGEADVDTAIAAVRAGAAGFLQKPFAHAEMEAAVERCFERASGWYEAPFPVRAVGPSPSDAAVLTRCAMLHEVCEVIKRIAPTPATVLVEGGSGTGKELAARSLHAYSGRSGSFVPINCGALSAELLESELFGHAKGAFTGAHQAREGLFAYADGGTLFLDEIAEMPLGMQGKLLRVLEDRKVRPVGGNREVAVDVRIVAATNRDLGAAVQQGVFREDLFYRINVLTVRMPTLRERREDIPGLVAYFVQTLAEELSVPPVAITDEDLRILQAHAWPGNVRELRNVIERALLLGRSPGACLPYSASAAADEPRAGPTPGAPVTLATLEKQHILAVLEQCAGNKSQAARQLAVSRKTLERKLQQWTQRPDA